MTASSLVIFLTHLFIFMPQIPEITVSTLKERLDSGETPFILDVRRKEEHEFVNIGGRLIQLDYLPDHLEELEAHKDEEIIVYCRSGARSGRAVQFLQSQGFEKAVNLTGGILAWSAEIDPSLPTY